MNLINYSHTGSRIALCGAALFLFISCGWGEFSARDAAPKAPMAVLFEIDGPLPQFAQPALFGVDTPSQFQLEKKIKRASNDILVQEIVFHIGAPQIGWTRALELSNAIARAAKRKPVTCLVTSADNQAYWMAARSCPTLLVAPAGDIALVGLAAENIFVKDLLDNIGIAIDVLAAGRYKNAAESLTRTDMSEASRETTTALLDSLHATFVSGISQGRKLPREQIDALIDNGPYTADDAHKAQLVDGVKSVGTLFTALSQKYEGGLVADYGKEAPKPIEVGDLFKLFSGKRPEATQDTKPKIALISLIGTIKSGRETDAIFAAEDSVYDLSLIETLAKAAEDKSVKAVVLRIDSPGGSALASDNIWEAVQALAAVKPVVASMGDVAASGGYYIASAATEVIAAPTTITGSIGVIGGKVVVQKAAEKWGVKSERIARGRNAGMLSPFEPFSEADRELLTRHIQHTYELFVARVSTGRDLPAEDVHAHAEGRVWSGADALKHKLVNATGTLETSIQRARKLIHDERIPVELYPQPRNFFEVIAEQLNAPTDEARLLSQLPGAQDATVLGQLLLRESVLAVSPHFLRIR
ncbi:MAG: signal peptide peptidase SppA [Myxococcales bacterium]|jgi:protease-4|nr:signal peptide peptidase SppA [Myxococcales bacterium]